MKLVLPVPLALLVLVVCEAQLVLPVLLVLVVQSAHEVRLVPLVHHLESYQAVQA